MKRLAELYMEKVREAGIEERVHPIIEAYFADMSARIRDLEREEAAAEPQERTSITSSMKNHHLLRRSLPGRRHRI